MEELKEKLKEKYKKPVIGAGIGIIVVILAVLIYCHYLSDHLVEANQSVNDLREQITALKQENDDLKLQNEELNEKVSILSDTVNSKVKEEEEREAEIAQAYVPTGFPLKGTAVIATAQGTVSSIAGNAESGYIIMIDHGNGYYSVYRNGAKPKVKEGDEVTTSTELFMIDAGHEQLGYQIIENDSYIDPLSLMEIYG